mgnify:CR=1 FL=1
MRSSGPLSFFLLAALAGSAVAHEPVAQDPGVDIDLNTTEKVHGCWEGPNGELEGGVFYLPMDKDARAVIEAVEVANRGVPDNRVDFVIVGVGIGAATALADAAGIVNDNGIMTDSHGRTSAPHVWAAGDCASFPYRGGRIRLESVPNAIDQAELVAENIMGADKEYVAKPWFWSDQYDVKLQIAGLNMGYDRVITRRSDADSVAFWYYRGDELLAVDAMNDPRGFMVGRRLIEAGKSPAPALIEDPNTDLKALLKS